ncbi:hypothetical protein NCS52_01576600 [Fusarium sp. LHS14.1]|nr:hypothetical protein NCS52_01576600 [Fusarium sp. LHS14.1]
MGGTLLLHDVRLQPFFNQLPLSPAAIGNMSVEICQQPQCTCSAFFLTSDSLNAHLEEYRSRESYLSAQLEICRMHSKANDDDPDSDNDDENPIASNGGSKTYYCPLKRCDRHNKPFRTRQRLRRHFERRNFHLLSNEQPPRPITQVSNAFSADVKCDEVCVCCHQVLRRVSEYIRHSKRHGQAGQTKTTYMSQMCNELHDRAANELKFAENERLSSVEKRRAQRVKSDGVGMMTTTYAQFLHVNGTPAVLPSAQSSTSAQPTISTQSALPFPKVVESVAINGFTNMGTGVFHPESIEGSSGALDDMNFDAPVNGIINFPEPWVGWMPEEPGTGDVGTGVVTYV